MSRWKRKIEYGYANGTEFINAETTETYVGPYFKIRDKFYQENPTQSTDQKFRLTKIPSSLNNKNVKQYNKITGNNFEPSKIIQPYFPRPQESDYKNTYFTRYIVQKRNELKKIYEISQTDFADISNNPLYSSTSFRWQLVGTPEDIAKKNADEIRKASEDIIGLRDFLPILTEFSKEDSTDKLPNKQVNITPTPRPTSPASVNRPAPATAISRTPVRNNLGY
jgi:hypothetical protein